MFSRHLAFNQNLVAGMVVFFSAGIYLAVLGLGAGGGKASSQVCPSTYVSKQEADHM